MTQGDLFGKKPKVLAVEDLPDFDGKTYEYSKDHARLGKQCVAVREVMKDGKWRTLRELADAVGAPEASVSARLRDLRKEKFGGHTVMRRRRGDAKKGLFEYCLEATP